MCRIPTRVPMLVAGAPTVSGQEGRGGEGRHHHPDRGNGISPQKECPRGGSMGLLYVDIFCGKPHTHVNCVTITTHVIPPFSLLKRTRMRAYDDAPQHAKVPLVYLIYIGARFTTLRTNLIAGARRLPMLVLHIYISFV